MSQKRKSYSVNEKIKIINRVKAGETKASLSRECGVPEGTIRGWMKEESKLLSFVEMVEEEVGLQRKKTKLSKDNELDECLYRWFLLKRSEGVPLSGPIVRAQALKFHKELNNNTDFNASDGWFSRWKSRHGISQINIEGEARSSDAVSAALFPQALQKVMDDENLSDHQIYNCDETALYYRMLPKKTLDVKKTANKSGLKMSKERVTLLLATNKSGNHKLKPLFIGKSRSPRCFKHVNMNSLPVIYRHTKNAWMTSEIFTKWFHEEFVPAVKRHLRSLKIEEKAVLILDNCPAHPPAEILQTADEKIKVMFLPKNTTALVQPLDQGIIRAFKAYYRRDLLNALVNSDEEIEVFLKALNLKAIVYSVGLAWENVSSAAIQNCWKKCCVEEITESISNTEFVNSDVKAASNIFQCDLSLQDLNNWIEEDNAEHTVEYVEVNDIVDTVRKEKSVEDSISTTNSDDNEDVEKETEDIPTASDVIVNIKKVISWMERQEESNNVHLLHLSIMQRYVEKKRFASSRQTTVTEYFNKI